MRGGVQHFQSHFTLKMDGALKAVWPRSTRVNHVVIKAIHSSAITWVILISLMLYAIHFLITIFIA